MMRHLPGRILVAVALMGCQTPTSPTADHGSEPATIDAPVPPETPATEDADPRVRVVSTPGEGSEEMFVLTAVDGEELAVPAEIQSGVQSAATPTVFAGGTLIVYDAGNALHLARTRDWKDETIATFDARADVLDYGWVSPNGRWLAGIVREPSSDGPSETKAFVFELDADGITASRRVLPLTPPPLIRCYSRCTVSDARIDDEGRFSYLVSGGPEDPESPDAPKVWKSAE